MGVSGLVGGGDGREAARDGFVDELVPVRDVVDMLCVE